MVILSKPHPDDITPAPDGQDCASCKAFCKVPGGGECRRHGPNGALVPAGPQGQLAGIGFWPSTRAEQWCADWISKKSN